MKRLVVFMMEVLTEALFSGTLLGCLLVPNFR